MSVNFTKENIDKLFKNSKNQIISTENGIIIKGDIVGLTTLEGMIILELLEQGIPKEILKSNIDLAFKEADIFNFNKSEEKDSKNSDKLEDLLKDFLKEIFN